MLVEVHARSDGPPGCGQAATGATQARYLYDHDARGNRITEHARTLDEATGALGLSQETAYGYDLADRLTGVRYPDGEATLYALGPTGRRDGELKLAGYPDPALSGQSLREVLLGEGAYGAAQSALTGQSGALGSLQRERGYGYDPGDLLASVTQWPGMGPQGAASTHEVLRDAQGRVTQLSLPQGTGVLQTRSLSWDAAGRLRRAETTVTGVVAAPTRNVVLYDYDAGGLRIGAKAEAASGTPGPSGSTAWLWSGTEVVQESGGVLGPVAYTRAGSLLVGVGAERVIRDGLGSVIGRVDAATGVLSGRRRYDAWGEHREGTKPDPSEPSVGYTGHLWDADTELVYAKARWLAPEIGGFLSVDPAFGSPAQPMSMAAYLYGRANPLRFVDPLGAADEDYYRNLPVEKHRGTMLKWYHGLKQAWKKYSQKQGEDVQDNPLTSEDANHPVLALAPPGAVVGAMAYTSPETQGAFVASGYEAAEIPIFMIPDLVLTPDEVVTSIVMIPRDVARNCYAAGKDWDPVAVSQCVGSMSQGFLIGSLTLRARGVTGPSFGRGRGAGAPPVEPATPPAPESVPAPPVEPGLPQPKLLPEGPAAPKQLTAGLRERAAARVAADQAAMEKPVGPFDVQPSGVVVFRAADLVRGSSPIPIPKSAVALVQPKKGYTQIRFRWEADGYKFEARWHTRTPGAPETQGSTWQISRTTRGTSGNVRRVQHQLTGQNRWTPMTEWQAAVRARKNGTATLEQQKLLDSGHFPEVEN